MLTSSPPHNRGHRMYPFNRCRHRDLEGRGTCRVGRAFTAAPGLPLPLRNPLAGEESVPICNFDEDI